jgi:hypothetical protein
MLREGQGFWIAMSVIGVAICWAIILEVVL